MKYQLHVFIISLKYNIQFQQQMILRLNIHIKGNKETKDPKMHAHDQPLIFISYWTGIILAVGWSYMASHHITFIIKNHWVAQGVKNLCEV